MKNLFFKKRVKYLPLQEKPMPSLAACLVMDLLGFATYAVPFLGEFLDILWAPLSAAVYMKMFGFKKGFLGGVFNFVEELLPGLDFIPTFTISWAIHYFRRHKESVSLRTATR
jgi:hypothetical protein